MKSTTKNVLTKGPRRIRSDSLAWIFRTNIPHHREAPLPSGPDIHKRNFFGLGEIVSVIANPGETIRSLAESRKLLEEARQEIRENRERAQLRATHTFSPLPGFFPRPAEIRAIERVLEGVPSFTVLFGASSVGKTALLREVLSRDAYHVLHFDLRIAGFADLASLYMSLNQQMERYFDSIGKTMEGYEEFEKEAWSFKHDRLAVERRMTDAANGAVKTSDIARLMELFQSSLLKYWEFEPRGEWASDTTRVASSKASSSSATSAAAATSNSSAHQHQPDPPKVKWSDRMVPSKLREKEKGGRQVKEGEAKEGDESDMQEKQDGQSDVTEKRKPPIKKIPVFFLDEAHKLPALIQSTDAMKCILDSMLVLTKQDRLCHVIHATSDSFYQTWLRQLNVMQHCKIISIGDCSKAETKVFFIERLLPTVPEHLRVGLEFEELYTAFGGKLAHWSDFVTDYVNSNGGIDIKESSHFLQAHALLNLQIIHSSEIENPPEPERERETDGDTHHSSHRTAGPGFRIYSPLPRIIRNEHHASSISPSSAMDSSPGTPPCEFTAMQLLKVMSRLSAPGVTFLPYFLLCREFGARAVDAMVRGRILELRWTPTITREGPSIVDSGLGFDDVEEGDIVGPKLVPTTPIIGYAMKEVLREYADEEAASEYASLSDVDEY